MKTFSPVSQTGRKTGGEGGGQLYLRGYVQGGRYKCTVIILKRVRVSNVAVEKQ